MEKWDLLDGNRNFIGKTIERGNLLPKTDFHLIVHAWLKNDDLFLISRRNNSIFYGGFWQPTGGCAVSGDTSFETVCKETAEELGLCLDSIEAHFLFWYKSIREKTASFFLDAWLFDISTLVKQTGGNDAFLKNLLLQKEEVSDVRFVSFDEIIDLWKNGTFMPFNETFPPYFDLLREKILEKPQTPRIINVQQNAIARLKKSRVTSTAELDISLLLNFVLRKSREQIILHANDFIDEFSLQLFLQLLERRETGEPIAYITNKKFFWQYEFFITKNVLIPKPDTEVLVEKTLQVLVEKLSETEQKQKINCTIRIADICTGSGCVILSVLADLQNHPAYKNIFAFASDISSSALDVAKKNEEILLKKKQICFLQSDVLQSFTQNNIAIHYFDIIVSNPPYVPSQLAHELLQDGRNEPILALDGGKDGMDILKKVIVQATFFLKNGGTILLETGEYNAGATCNILAENAFKDIRIYQDLQGYDRVICAKKDFYDR